MFWKSSFIKLICQVEGGIFIMSGMPKKISSIIDEFVNGVKKILGNRVKKIILYGSYARGDYNKSSDIDIMILTDLSDDEIVKYRDKIWDYAYDIEFDNNFDIELSPLVKNIEKYNKRIDIIPFYYNVQKEGVVLNG